VYPCRLAIIELSSIRIVSPQRWPAAAQGESGISSGSERAFVVIEPTVTTVCAVVGLGSARQRRG
jgi:hypothetical protein